MIRRSRFWLPLIALHTGMRMEEILQFAPRDVRRSPRGVPFLVLHRDMRLKTSASKREHQIHPTLERIGLLEFVEERSRQGAKLLFDDIPQRPDGYRSSVFSKRFATFVRSLGIRTQQSRTCFHSFRHNFRDELRRASVSEEHAEALGGWSRGKKASRSYGSGFEAESLYPEIQKLKFEGLDLSHLDRADR